jgi:hypothetical protein
MNAVRTTAGWKLRGGLTAAALVALTLGGTGCDSAATQETQETQGEQSSGWRGFLGGPRTVEVTVPTGTVLDVQFDETVSSASAATGDRFSATVVEGVTIDGKTAIAPGATVTGRVVEAVRSKRIGGRARLNLEFTSLHPSSGDEVPLSASFSQRGKSQTKKDAATIGGATAGGALLGNIIGNNNDNEGDGTTLGAIAGAAIGTGVAASNRGQDVVIPAGTVLQIELDAPVQVRVSA